MVDNVAVINEQRQSSLGWGAIVAGSFVAASTLFLLLAFGTSVGLSIVSPWGGQNPNPPVLALVTAAWFLIAAAASFWIGGYLAGRLRTGWIDVSAEDAKSGDGFHGLIAWALGIVILTWMGVAGASVAAAGANASAETVDPQAYILDTLFRAPSGASGTDVDTLSRHREQAGRVLARGAAGTPLSPDDRTYLVGLVAADTGITEAQAEQRVQRAIASAKESADTARELGIFAGFLTVSGLFIAAAAGWLGAVHGGQKAPGRMLRNP